MGWFGSSFLDELSFVLGWATWPAPEYVIGIHLPPGDHDSPSRDQWKSLEYIYEYMALKTYFIFCQMNCSIQLELLVDFFICLNGMIWSLFLDELSFVLGWATWPAPEYVIGTPASWWPWLAIPRPMEKPGIYMNIWLWNIFHILPNELLDPTWAFGGFLHLSPWDDLEVHF